MGCHDESLKGLLPKALEKKTKNNHFSVWAAKQLIIGNSFCKPGTLKNKNSSSTAQGGGGSFKKRKTIGEIGCCESRMSKQKH